MVQRARAAGEDEVTEAGALARSLLANLRRVIRGKDDALGLALVAVLSGGHLLIEDVPGVGKTLLAKALARSMGGDFRRVQATPDLLPADLTGISVLAAEGWEFRPGPLFGNVVLVDEINRAGPKTQSALLEAMEERQVSVERSARPLPADFLVLATQNPREFEGTYPLPESQLDRFMLRIDMTYPDRAAETEILTRYGGLMVPGPGTLESVEVLQSSLLEKARLEAERIHVADGLLSYVLDIAAASRGHPRLSLGLSTRGALALSKAARITAGLRGGDFVTPDDVKEAAPWVIAHRLVLTPEAALEGLTDLDVVRALLAETPVPR